MKTYRKRPETVKAVQWLGQLSPIRDFFGYDLGAPMRVELPNNDLILPPPKSGDREVSVPLGCWLIEDLGSYRSDSYQLLGPEHFKKMYKEDV